MKAAVAAAAMLCVGATALTGTLTARASTGEDWTSFGHDAAHTRVSPDTAVSATAATSMAIQWHKESGGGTRGHAGIASTPAVVYNATLKKTVVYTTSTGTPAQLTAFNAANGFKLWSFSIDKGTSSSPAVYGNTVYFGDQDHSVYAVDATTGALQCSYTTTGRIDSSPVVGDVDGTGPVIYIGDFGLTEQQNSGHEWAINGVGNTNGDCTLKWRFNNWANKGPKGDRTGTWDSPALAQDPNGRWLVILGSSNPDDSVYALDAVSGTQVWRFQTLITENDQDVGAPPSISAPGVNGIADGAVYVNGKDKIEYALDLLTGTQLWSFDMAGDAGLLTNSVSGTAIVGGDVVVSYGKFTYALDAVNGTRVWRTQQTAGQLLASPSVSGPAGDQVVFEGDLQGNEYAYKMSDGSVVNSWNVGSNASIVGSVAISDGHVYFGARSPGNLYALS